LSWSSFNFGGLLVVLGLLGARGTRKGDASATGSLPDPPAYEGWLGVVAAFCGVWDVTAAIANVGMRLAGRVWLAWWVSWLATGVLMLTLGVLLAAPALAGLQEGGSRRVWGGVRDALGPERLLLSLGAIGVGGAYTALGFFR